MISVKRIKTSVYKIFVQIYIIIVVYTKYLQQFPYISRKNFHVWLAIPMGDDYSPFQKKFPQD